MQVFTDFNEKMGAKRFDADAFTLVLMLGGHAFCKFTGSTKLTFKKGKAEVRSESGQVLTPEVLTWVRMNLKENPKGFNRLKLHYHPDEKVDMEFYTVSDVPGLEDLLVGETVLFKEIPGEYLYQAFQNVTGIGAEEATTDENPFE